MCISVQSIITCGDVILPNTKRIIMMQLFLCSEHVCVGIRRLVTLKVRSEGV